MRFVASPAHEEYEARALPRSFGKAYTPHGSVTLRHELLLERPGVELVELDGATLAIQPDTASWAFLTPGEAALLAGLAGQPFAWLAERWPAGAAASPAAFVAALFYRGLLSIEGQTAVAPTIFDDSSNTHEGHLIELLVTEKCNLGCVYCLAGTSPAMPVMTPEIARRTIDLAYRMEEASSLAFEFSGGEPFMKFPLLRELVPYIRDHPERRGRPVFFHMQSNGTLLNEERVRWLKEHEIRLGLSLDGDPASHNRSRPQLGGGESFSRLLAGIDLLQRYEVPFGVLIVLNRHNVASAAALVDFLLDNGLGSFKLNPVAYLGTARSAWDDVGLRQEEVIAYFIELLTLVAARGYPLLEDNVRTMCEFLVSKQRQTRCLRSHCGAGDTFQAVSASGDIYPCGRATQTPGLKLGNVRDRELISLAAPARSSPVISELRARRPRTLDGCDTCHYRQLCQAGCSAQAFERYGSVRHRTPECAFFKTLYPFLMRWLSFDAPAFHALKGAGYFHADAVLYEHSFVA